MKKENISLKFIKNYYEVLFYWSFVNFKRELQLKNLLELNNFTVKFSNLKLDSIFKVDLIVKKNNIRYFLQLKNKFENLNQEEKQILMHFSNSRNSIPILVIRKGNKYIFWNLIIQEEVKFLE
ncbi:excisionase [Metamycoplasma alkalescens]|nr:excisionase [Metamycoplasma alkalescens]